MSRVSRRGITDRNEISAQNPSKVVWQAAIYARLSVDGEEKKRESIEVQVEAGRQFVDQNADEIQMFQVYQDIGKSGSNFQRQGFIQMMEAVKEGRINCIIVKDLSRFARNYIEAGTYLERIFPLMGIRFISLTENFDSWNIESANQMMEINIRNLFHDMYAKESSNKAQNHIQMRAKKGIYVGGIAPYGYQRHPTREGNQLLVQHETAKVVQIIFRAYEKQGTLAAVIRTLSKERISSPAIYQKTGRVRCSDSKLYQAWPGQTVKKILTNPVYMGDMVQGKSQCLGRLEQNRIYKDRQEWIVVENTHEAIIERSLFQRVNEMLEQKRSQKQTMERDPKNQSRKHNLQAALEKQCNQDDEHQLQQELRKRQRLRLDVAKQYENYKTGKMTDEEFRIAIECNARQTRQCTEAVEQIYCRGGGRMNVSDCNVFTSVEGREGTRGRK